MFTDIKVIFSLILLYNILQCTTDLNGQTRLQKEGYPISYGGHWDNNYMYNENTKMFKSTNKH